MSTINFKAIGLLEVLKGMNGYGKKYHLYQEFLRGGEILTTLRIKEMLMFQGKEEQLLDSKELKV